MVISTNSLQLERGVAPPIPPQEEFVLLENIPQVSLLLAHTMKACTHSKLMSSSGISSKLLFILTILREEPPTYTSKSHSLVARRELEDCLAL